MWGEGGVVLTLSATGTLYMYLLERGLQERRTASSLSSAYSYYCTYTVVCCSVHVCVVGYLFHFSSSFPFAYTLPKCEKQSLLSHLPWPSVLKMNTRELAAESDCIHVHVAISQLGHRWCVTIAVCFIALVTCSNIIATGTCKLLFV